MGQTTGISWTDSTWSPLRVRVKQDAPDIAKTKGYTSLVHIAEKMVGHTGPHCEHVSEGCRICYSDTNNHRCLPANGTGLPFDRRSRDLVEPFIDEKILRQPMSWKKPRKIFPMNQSDLFGEWWNDEQILAVFQTMAKCPSHTFQVLTKRIERAKEWLSNRRWRNLGHSVAMGGDHYVPIVPDEHRASDFVCLPNVWLGVSVESNAEHVRVWELLKTPAWRRFISYEPALGPLDLHKWELVNDTWRRGATIGKYLDLVIAGGESGRGARPSHPDWYRTVQRQCAETRTSFFFKQRGHWTWDKPAKPVKEWGTIEKSGKFLPLTTPWNGHGGDTGEVAVFAVGNGKSGDLLDGKRYQEFPA